MSRLARPALLLPAVLCAFLAAGCASGSAADLAKVHFQRTTVPASQGGGDDGSSGQPVAAANDPAFTSDKLRLIDPCGLLDNNTLSGLGTPGDNTPSGFDGCDNEMKDSGGNDLDVMVTVGDILDVTKVSGQLSGMQVAEQQENDECTDKIVTQSSPMMGIAVEATSKNNPCSASRKVAQAVIDRIRANPPQRQNTQGSLVAIDPCTTIDDLTAGAAVGGTAQKTALSLYKCDWANQDDSYDLTVSFDIGGDPKSDNSEGNPQPVDLGGFTAYQVLSTDVYPSCEVKWMTRQTDTTSGEGEVVDVELDNVEKAQVDTCAKAVAVAKVVATKVPKPS